MNPSSEQIAIVDALETHNVIVNSVPGSGKSTTIYFIVEKYIDTESILILTYNRKLKDETKEKINNKYCDKECIPEVHTYHSFCQKTWGIVCSTDTGIREAILMDDCCDYSMVIIDEAQDMTPLYFNILKKIIQPDTKVILVGDKKQSIYQFNGADSRFLTLSDKLIKSDRPFMNLTLSVSYRLSKPIVDFMNDMLGENTIKPSPLKLEKYPKPRYVKDNFFGLGIKRVIDDIKNYIKNGYTANDIFILAPTVKAPSLNEFGKPKSNFSIPQHLVNSLLQEKIKVFVPNNDSEEVVDLDIVKDKIVFCSYHRSKGLERKIVYVLGVDDSYCQYYDKHGDPNVCSNAMYVALTRSAEHLIILHHYTRDYVNFINEKSLLQYTDFVEYKKTNKNSIKQSTDPKYLAPSIATQHVKSEVIYNTMQMMKIKEIRKSTRDIRLMSKYKDEDNCENISEITSVYISYLHSIFHHHEDEIKKLFIHVVHCGDPDCNLECILGKSVFSFTPAEIFNVDCTLYEKKVIQKLLRATTKLCGINNGYMHKFKQLKSFNWLSSQNVHDLIVGMNRLLSDDCKYEISTISPDCTICDNSCAYCIKVPTETQNIKFNGRIDIVDHKKKIVWEIKCVQDLKDVHYIQLLIYKYLCNLLGLYTDYKYFLCNIRTGEIHQILSTDLDNIVRYLIIEKFSPYNDEGDKKFIEKFK